ncbi:rCG61655 [Rattus norvegicus]|uniref:RCG61655 n=1 Tax=Rattus norvegicus TaxID=10116 RepID=A6HAG1_RAT|nr:rCG61655 [Rattus norvegicus]
MQQLQGSTIGSRHHIESFVQRGSTSMLDDPLHIVLGSAERGLAFRLCHSLKHSSLQAGTLKGWPFKGLALCSCFGRFWKLQEVGTGWGT